jgi:hypothetical protein
VAYERIKIGNLPSFAVGVAISPRREVMHRMKLLTRTEQTASQELQVKPVVPPAVSSLETVVEVETIHVSHHSDHEFAFLACRVVV